MQGSRIVKGCWAGGRRLLVTSTAADGAGGAGGAGARGGATGASTGAWGPRAHATKHYAGGNQSRQPTPATCLSLSTSSSPAIPTPPRLLPPSPGRIRAPPGLVWPGGAAAGPGRLALAGHVHRRGRPGSTPHTAVGHSGLPQAQLPPVGVLVQVRACVRVWQEQQ